MNGIRSSLPSEVKLGLLLRQLCEQTSVKAKLGVGFGQQQNIISTIKPKSYMLNSATVDDSGLATNETEGLINVNLIIPFLQFRKSSTLY